MKDLERMPGFWGGCPECGGETGCLTVQGEHFMYCEAHKCFWGADLNMEPDAESQDSEENGMKLITYREVVPRKRQKALDEKCLMAERLADKLTHSTH